MGKNNLFDDIGNLSNASYLLDPDASDNFMNTVQKTDKEILQIDRFVAFKNHPFKVNTEDDDFVQLVDSIRENGVIYPILVRPKDDKYEIIAGHRRVEACKYAGVTEVPVIIREMDDYDATIVMVHSNFYREKISISEKAKAYRMCMDAEKHQGKKGLDTAAMIGENQDSKRQVYRFVRLSYLSDGLLNYVDIGKIAMNVGVELSYVDATSQQAMLSFFDEYSIFPSIEQAKELRTLSEGGEKIDKNMLISTLLGEVKKKKTSSVSFKRKELEDFFDKDVGNDYIQDIIIKLLQKYKAGEIDNI